jgi:exonuclease III
MDMRFGTWNVRGLYRVGSLETVASELAEFEIDLVAVQKFRWDKCGSQQAESYKFLYGNVNADHHIGTCFFVHQRIRSSLRLLVV